jgi:hypothetical protein
MSGGKKCDEGDLIDADVRNNQRKKDATGEDAKKDAAESKTESKKGEVEGLQSRSRSNPNEGNVQTDGKVFARRGKSREAGIREQH